MPSPPTVRMALGAGMDIFRAEALDQSGAAHEAAQGVVFAEGFNVFDHGFGQDVGVFLGEIGMGEEAVQIRADPDGGFQAVHSLDGHLDGEEPDVLGGGFFHRVLCPVQMAEFAA